MNIYVGNLSYQMTEDDLRIEFEKFGTVSYVVLNRRSFRLGPRFCGKGLE